MADLSGLGQLHRMLHVSASSHDQQQFMHFFALLSRRGMELGYEYMNNPEWYEATLEQMTAELIAQQGMRVRDAGLVGL